MAKTVKPSLAASELGNVLLTDRLFAITQNIPKAKRNAFKTLEQSVHDYFSENCSTSVFIFHRKAENDITTTYLYDHMYQVLAMHPWKKTENYADRESERSILMVVLDYLSEPFYESERADKGMFIEKPQDRFPERLKEDTQKYGYHVPMNRPKNPTDTFKAVKGIKVTKVGGPVRPRKEKKPELPSVRKLWTPFPDADVVSVSSNSVVRTPPRAEPLFQQTNSLPGNLEPAHHFGTTFGTSMPSFPGRSFRMIEEVDALGGISDSESVRQHSEGGSQNGESKSIVTVSDVKFFGTGFSVPGAKNDEIKIILEAFMEYLGPIKTADVAFYGMQRLPVDQLAPLHQVGIEELAILFGNSLYKDTISEALNVFVCAICHERMLGLVQKHVSEKTMLNIRNFKSQLDFVQGPMRLQNSFSGSLSESLLNDDELFETKMAIIKVFWPEARSLGDIAEKIKAVTFEVGLGDSPLRHQSPHESDWVIENEEEGRRSKRNFVIKIRKLKVPKDK